MLLAEKYATADLNAALSYAKNEGRELERKLLTYEVVRDGELSPEKGAKRLGITVEELKQDRSRLAVNENIENDCSFVRAMGYAHGP